MLPRLYTLHSTPAVGYLYYSDPHSIYCPECGRMVGRYDDVELVLDHWPEYDLVQASEGSYFASERLLARLEKIGATGYTHQPATFSLSPDYRRLHPEIAGLPIKLPQYRYFVITGRCDGPWINSRKAGVCPVCGKARAEIADLAGAEAELLGHVPPRSRLVYPETWHGEDFFYLSEPGPPLITDRVAIILAETGNLRRHRVMDIDETRFLVPRRTERSEVKPWGIERSADLGPCDWVMGPWL